MAKNRTHSIDVKRQVAQDYLAGETLHGLAKRHDLSRNLIRIWARKYEAGASMRTRPRPNCSSSMKHGLPPLSGSSASRPSNLSF